MKFGDMILDVNLKGGFLNLTKRAFVGHFLIKKHKEYEYLYDDPDLKNQDEYLESVVYAYMVDQLLKKHPELTFEYKNHIQRETTGLCKKSEKCYSSINEGFLSWYENYYLREQANPGIVERERQEAIREQKALENARQVKEWRKQQELQQDLAAGTRVICPYCKSADTKKLTALNRAVSVSLVGAASSKLGKQWHCNHCGSDF